MSTETELGLSSGFYEKETRKEVGFCTGNRSRFFEDRHCYTKGRQNSFKREKGVYKNGFKRAFLSKVRRDYRHRLNGHII